MRTESTNSGLNKQNKFKQNQEYDFPFIFSENPLYKIGALREHFPVALSLKILCVACYDIKEWD